MLRFLAGGHVAVWAERASALNAADAAKLRDALDRATQAPAVRVPRPGVRLPFAVLLMRSGYEALEELNVYDMRQFQIDFWRLRADAQPNYASLISPATFQQGVLTDPLYFDFVNYSQWATTKGIIARSAAFNEQLNAQSADGPLRGALTPVRYRDEVADTLYGKLRSGFMLTPESEVTTFGAPEPCADSDVACAVDGVRKLLDVMAQNGYATRIEVVTSDDNPAEFRVVTTGACTLWGANQLRRSNPLVLPGGDPLLNTFDALAIIGFLRASKGFAFATKLESVDDLKVVTRWSLVRAER